MAGGGGFLGPAMGQAVARINQAENMSNTGRSPGFIPPSQLSQQASYKPGVSGPSNISPMPTMSNDLIRPVAPQTPQQLSPFAQQMMQRSMAPQPIMGLPAALMQMRGQLNQPMMRPQMPTYQNPALGYRPNMAPAMEALNRVQPSVAEQQRRQAVEDARRAAEEAAAAAAAGGDGGPALQSYYDWGGGG